MTSENRQGIAVTGEFLSITPGKEWTGKDGVIRHPINVKILVNDATVKIEYRDSDAAQDAIVEAADGALPQRGDVVTVPVFAQAKGKDWLAYSGVSRRQADS
jgi:hypothetical protein